MKTKLFLIWALALILTFVVDGLCLKFLSNADLSTFDILIMRGASCLVFVLLLAAGKGYSLIPRSISVQLSRAALAGLALSLILWSYHFLTASAVSMISSIDVPLLVLLGPLWGAKTSKVVFGLSVFSILALIGAVAHIEQQKNFGLGVLSLVSGSILICFGYLFIKKSMREENPAVTVLTPSLALVIYGSLQLILFHSKPFVGYSLSVLLVGLLSGLTMFFAYVITMKLYELADIAMAEFPALLSGFFILPFEAYIFKVHFGQAYVILSGVFILGVAGILFFRHHQNLRQNLSQGSSQAMKGTSL